MSFPSQAASKYLVPSPRCSSADFFIPSLRFTSSPQLHLISLIPTRRQVTVVAKSKLSLTRTSRSLFSSLSSFAPKAAGPALVLATHSTFNRSEWRSRAPTVTAVTQTRYASNKDKKNKNKMPPKKVVKEEPVLLGRPGNNLNAGIVCTNMYVLSTASLA